MVNKLIPFQVKGISIQEFATIASSHKEGGKIDIKTGFNFGVNNDQHSLVVLFNLTFECDKKPFIILKLNMIFDVKANAFKKFKNEKKITVPKHLISHLAAMTVSTARGVLHVKLEPTPFNSFLLPAMNVSEILKDDLQFDL
jgi:hypothetical protein